MSLLKRFPIIYGERLTTNLYICSEPIQVLIDHFYLLMLYCLQSKSYSFLLLRCFVGTSFVAVRKLNIKLLDFDILKILSFNLINKFFLMLCMYEIGLPN